MPGAHFLQEHGVQYTCVAGRVVRGDRKAPARSLERYSFGSYAQVRACHACMLPVGLAVRTALMSAEVCWVSRLA